MFESVDRRMNGRRLESHPISSSRAFGSGELNIGKRQTTEAILLLYLLIRVS